MESPWWEQLLLCQSMNRSLWNRVPWFCSLPALMLLACRAVRPKSLPFLRENLSSILGFFSLQSRSKTDGFNHLGVGRALIRASALDIRGNENAFEIREKCHTNTVWHSSLGPQWCLCLCRAMQKLTVASTWLTCRNSFFYTNFEHLLSTWELGIDLQAPSVHVWESSSFSGKKVIRLLIHRSFLHLLRNIAVSIDRRWNKIAVYRDFE